MHEITSEYARQYMHVSTYMCTKRQYDSMSKRQALYMCQARKFRIHEKVIELKSYMRPEAISSTT